MTSVYQDGPGIKVSSLINAPCRIIQRGTLRVRHWKYSLIKGVLDGIKRNKSVVLFVFDPATVSQLDFNDLIYGFSHIWHFFPANWGQKTKQPHTSTKLKKKSVACRSLLRIFHGTASDKKACCCRCTSAHESLPASF